MYNLPIVFVIGLGRSGTNMLGRFLAKSPDTLCDLERQPQFNLSIRAAILGSEKAWRELISVYADRLAVASNTNKLYCTKDHVNIWQVLRLANRFPNAKFINIERDVYGVVASSLLHKGVMGWIENDYPPNPLSANNVVNFEELTPVERLVERWLQHKTESRRLQQLLDATKLVSINFAEFEAAEQSICDFLDITSPDNFNFNATTVNKWQEQLTKQTIAEIEAYLNG